MVIKLTCLECQQDGNTALHFASRKGHLTVAKALLATANVNAMSQVVGFEVSQDAERYVRL